MIVVIDQRARDDCQADPAPDARLPTRRSRHRRPTWLTGLALGCVLLAPPTHAATVGPDQGPVTIRVARSHHADPVLASLLEAAQPGARANLRFDFETMPSTAVLREICQLPTPTSPQLVVTTRPMSSARAKDCPMLARGELTSIQLGRDAIVLAMRADSQPLLLNTYDIYRAIARDVPAGDEFRRNVAIRWSDIDPALPQKDIRFQLPPAHDHRRHIFDTLILEGGCRKEGQVKGIYEASLRTARCVTTRMDRVREIAREHAIRSLLDAPPGTIGVLSYQELEENADKLVAIPLDGVMPTDLTIQEGTYSFATSKWLFAQRGPTAVGADSRVQDEITRLTMLARSEAMIGPNGAIIRTGLVPLAADEREGQRAALADAEHPIDLAWFANWVFSATASTWNMASYAVGDMRASEPKNAVDLAKLMDIAGYKLAEFESSIGLIPSAAMTFKITREMSESDRDYLERELYKDSRQRRGIRSALQRWLIRTIIDISDSDDYQVSKVEVKLLPLPAVNLRVTPQGYGSGSDAATVLRAIERLQDRLPETLQ